MKEKFSSSHIPDKIAALLEQLRSCPREAFASESSPLPEGISDTVVEALDALRSAQEEIDSKNEKLFKTERELIEIKERLEVKIKERTSQLLDANRKLAREVREREAIESYMQVCNALLRFLHQSSSRDEYLDCAVRVIQAWSGCQCVGIRILDDSGAIPYAAYVGYSHQFWESENHILLNRDNCICTRVISRSAEPQDLGCMTPGGSFLCDDTLEFASALDEEKKARFRGACIKTGFKSVGVVPVRFEGKTLGAIHFADPSPGQVTWLEHNLEAIAVLVGEAVSKFQVREILHRDGEIQKQNEMEAQRRRDELAHFGRVATIAQIASSLAHELNQPLTAILTNAQAALRLLAAESPDLEEVKAAIEDIMDDDMRAGKVIRSLRSMLKKTDSTKSVFDLNSVVRETVRLVANDAVRRGVSVATDLATDLPAVTGDLVQLQQVLLNLMLNGFDAMKDIPADSRRMVVRTSRYSAGPENGEAACVSVCDNGPEIDTEVIGRIFDSFFTTKPDGLGMGLSISRTIVEAHGGSIWACRDRELGTTFCFTLPVEHEK